MSEKLWELTCEVKVNKQSCKTSSYKSQYENSVDSSFEGILFELTNHIYLKS